MLHALRFDLFEQAIDRSVRLAFEPQRAGGHVVIFDVGDNLTESAEAGRKLRQNDGIDPHFAGERGDVSGGRAAGSDQHEVARVIAALHRYTANAVYHVAVNDGEHAVRGALDRYAERVGDALDRLAGF